MNRNISGEEIIVAIENILDIHFSQDVNFNYSLLNPIIGMNPRDLLEIFFGLQKIYDIKFKNSDILDKRFDFLDGITEAVNERLNKKKIA